MYIDKLIKKEVITLLVSVSLLVIIFIGVTYAKFLSVDKGQDTVINMGDLNISFCKDTTCDTTYTNIGQVIGTKIENGASVPGDIYPFKNDGSYSNETPYIFKVTNTGSLDSTVKIKLKEDASFTPSGDYSSYARLTSKYAGHLKVAIRKKVLYQDTGYQLGDVNLDGIVNTTDTNLILDYVSKIATFTDLQKKLADIDSDSGIDSFDAVYLLQLINGKENIEGAAPTHIYSYTDLEDGVIFKDDTIKAGESATYFLWLYLDNTTPNDAQKTYFVGNIDV
ncbi:MAG: dockerin type I repeat-containing protein, partial [Clostridium sp.]|nr:dockerin type I repeat-containing protein [Clostridium sp.]